MRPTNPAAPQAPRAAALACAVLGLFALLAAPPAAAEGGYTVPNAAPLAAEAARREGARVAQDAVGVVTFRTVELTCAAGPLVDLSDPGVPACDEASLVGRTLRLATGLAAQAVGTSGEDLEQLRRSLNDFTGGLIGGFPPL